MLTPLVWNQMDRILPVAYSVGRGGVLKLDIPLMATNSLLLYEEITERWSKLSSAE